MNKYKTFLIDLLKDIGFDHRECKGFEHSLVYSNRYKININEYSFAYYIFQEGIISETLIFLYNDVDIKNFLDVLKEHFFRKKKIEKILLMN
jgi:hypothetical protein